MTETDKNIILEQSFENERELNNLAYIIKDLLSGDPEAAKKPEYAHLNLTQVRVAIDWIINSGIDNKLQDLVISKPWALAFKDEPPTPEQFLTPKYIGAMSESIWFPVKKNFIEFFDPMKPYRAALLNPSINAGKALTLDTKIWTSNKSFCFLKDTKLNQEIQNPDGTKSKIIGIYPQGKIATYKLKMSNGEYVKCNDNHIWRVSYRRDSSNNKIWENVTTKFIMDNKSNYKFEIPNNKSMDKSFLSDRSEFK